jgi:hypothetical protein
MTETPRSHLETHARNIQQAGAPEIVFLRARAQADIACATEIIEAMAALTEAVNDMANRSVTVRNNLIDGVDKATAQSKAASIESGKVAVESANLSRKLNRLTFWIVAAAIGSPVAAIVQAVVAVYAVTHD